MTPTNRLRQEFEAWAGKRESAPTTSAWDYAFKAWQAATLAEREACAKLCVVERYTGYVPPEDGAAREYYEDAAQNCANAIRARA
jgi:ferric-dicitrate binding protein FerR (iron transport regulator)